MRAFLLGLSNGAACIAYCTPALIPYLLGGQRGVKENIPIVLLFLLGRLLGYLGFGALIHAAAAPVLKAFPYHELILGPSFIIFSIMLILYAFLRHDGPCPARRFISLQRWTGRLSPFLVPVAGGVVTGLNFCPPFLLAATGALEQGSLLQTLIFFALFFVGTSVFFAAIPFVGLLRAFAPVRIIGTMAAGLIGLYYLYAGSIMLAGGMWKAWK